MTRVKICGLMQPEDLTAARNADAVGVVVEISGRRRSQPASQAAALFQSASAYQTRVVVTDITDPQVLWEQLDETRADVLQVHARLGSEEWAELLGEMGRNIIPVLMADSTGAFPDLDTADAVVLEGGGGGTGTLGDWNHAAAWREAYPEIDVILAGGLNPENVAHAIDKVRPYAVDVSSGVEVDGSKDPARIQAFIEAARSV